MHTSVTTLTTRLFADHKEIENIGTVRAIDVGFGNTKYSESYKAGSLVVKMFPSKTPSANGIPSDPKNGMSKHDVKLVSYQGRDYWVGPDVEYKETSANNMLLHDKYIYSDEYQALALGVLSHMNTPR